MSLDSPLLFDTWLEHHVRTVLQVCHSMVVNFHFLLSYSAFCIYTVGKLLPPPRSSDGCVRKKDKSHAKMSICLNFCSEFDLAFMGSSKFFLIWKLFHINGLSPKAECKVLLWPWQRIKMHGKNMVYTVEKLAVPMIIYGRILNITEPGSLLKFCELVVDVTRKSCLNQSLNSCHEN